MVVANRRSKQTKKQLREAFARLLLRHDYDALSVEDITAEADLGRTTFYLHYYDKAHLLAATLSELEDTLVRTIIDLSRGGENLSAAMFTHFFRDVETHGDLYSILLSEKTAGRALNRVRRDLRRFFAEVLESGELPRAVAGSPETTFKMN